MNEVQRNRGTGTAQRRADGESGATQKRHCVCAEGKLISVCCGIHRCHKGTFGCPLAHLAMAVLSYWPLTGSILAHSKEKRNEVQPAFLASARSSRNL